MFSLEKSVNLISQPFGNLALPNIYSRFPKVSYIQSGRQVWINIPRKVHVKCYKTSQSWYYILLLFSKSTMQLRNVQEINNYMFIFSWIICIVPNSLTPAIEASRQEWMHFKWFEYGCVHMLCCIIASKDWLYFTTL